MTQPAESLLIITGSMGSGKSSVLAEASDILTLRGIEHAAVDVDALEFGHFPRQPDDRMIYRNLRCVWENYGSSGLRRLMIARAIEDRNELQQCLRSVPAAQVSICRLTSSIETMEQRVRRRELGLLQESFIERVKQLNVILDRAKLEGFCVQNENRPITQVATEMLERAGWI